MSTDLLDKAIAAILKHGEPLDYEGLLHWPKPAICTPALASIETALETFRGTVPETPDADAQECGPVARASVERMCREIETEIESRHSPMADCDAEEIAERIDTLGMEMHEMQEKLDQLKSSLNSVDAAFLRVEKRPSKGSGLQVPIVDGRLNRTTKMSPWDWLAAKKHLGLFAAALDQLLQIDDSVDWRARLPAEAYFQEASRYQATLHDCVKLLCLAAVYRGIRMRWTDWHRYLNSAIRLTSSISSIQLGMSHIVFCSCCKTVVDTLEFLLCRATSSTGARAELSAGLRSLDDESLLSRAYIGERVFMLDSVRVELPVELRNGAWWQRVPEDKVKGVCSLVETLEKMIGAAKRPTHERLSRLAATRESLTCTESLADIRDNIGVMIAPIAINSMLSLTRTRLALAALSLLPYGVDKGAREVTLSAVPCDPFDGAPIRYRQLNDGFMVYSVGLDGMDSGGCEEPMHEGWWWGLISVRQSCKDIVFKVTRKAGP